MLIRLKKRKLLLWTVIETSEFAVICSWRITEQVPLPKIRCWNFEFIDVLTEESEASVFFPLDKAKLFSLNCSVSQNEPSVIFPLKKQYFCHWSIQCQTWTFSDISPWKSNIIFHWSVQCQKWTFSEQGDKGKFSFHHWTHRWCSHLVNCSLIEWSFTSHMPSYVVMG